MSASATSQVHPSQVTLVGSHAQCCMLSFLNFIPRETMTLWKKSKHLPFSHHVYMIVTRIYFLQFPGIMWSSTKWWTKMMSLGNCGKIRGLERNSLSHKPRHKVQEAIKGLYINNRKYTQLTLMLMHSCEWVMLSLQ